HGKKYRQRQDQEALPKRELNKTMNHSIAVASVLKRVGEVQEQAAVADDSVSGRKPTQDLCLAVLALADGDGAAGELVLAGRDVNERLVFVIAQDGRIRHGNRV